MVTSVQLSCGSDAPGAKGSRIMPARHTESSTNAPFLAWRRAGLGAYHEHMRQGRHAIGIVPGHANLWRVFLGAGALHAVVACGGAAGDGTPDEAAAPVPIAPSAGPVQILARPEPVTPASSPPPAGDGVPLEIAELERNPPARLDTQQFESALGYYCVSCHATPACSASCDGFYFDDWIDLLSGGNVGVEGAERMLSRVVDRVSDESMPPESRFVPRELPASTRQLMVEFLLVELRTR